MFIRGPGGLDSWMDGSVIYWIFSGGPGSDYGWLDGLLGIGMQVAEPLMDLFGNLLG